MTGKINTIHQDAVLAVKSHNEFVGHKDNILAFMNSLFNNVLPEAPPDAPMHIRNLLKGLLIILADTEVYRRLVDNRMIPSVYTQTFVSYMLWEVLEFFETMNGVMAQDELLEYSLEKLPQQFNNEEFLTALRDSYTDKLRVQQFSSSIKNLKAV